MNKIQRARFEKLASFLDTLPRENFNFSLVLDTSTCPAPASDTKNTRPSLECGSVGCAIGWTPTVFPRLVEARPDPRNRAFPNLLINKGNGVESTTGVGAVACHLFGLRGLVDPEDGHASWEIDELFCPGRFALTLKHGTEFRHCLDGNSTPQQVAGMMRDFLKAVDRDQALGAKKAAKKTKKVTR